MHLGDGIAPLLQYIAKGVPVNVGTDANISVDLWKEVRSADWLQRVSAMEMGQIRSVSNLPPSLFLFQMATKHGERALNLPVGEIKPGYFADFLVLSSPDASFIGGSSEQYLNELIFNAEISLVVDSVYVGGNLVYSRSERFPNLKIENLLKDLERIG
jgi:5-methylthioadenosine/S-adenosylhomocysteine deaminase